MVRIVLGGQWRGTQESWNSLKEFKEYHNAEVYVSSHEDWKLPFDFHYHRGIQFLEDTIFRFSTNSHRNRYNYQWSGLYNCWKAFNNYWDSDDIIVRLRVDLEFPIFQLNPKPNTFHVPAKEWHAPPFPKELICNDQLSYGYKDVMDKYLQLPYTFNWNYPRQIGAINMHNGIYSIEEMTRNHLYDKGIELETFDLIYHKKE